MEYILDAKNQKLGRLASRAALILQGKTSPRYEPRLSGQDKVVVMNLKDLDFDRAKLSQKKYYHHTGYMGHLKAASLKERWQKNPTEVFRSVVAHMLPKNRLQKSRLKRLIIE